MSLRPYLILCVYLDYVYYFSSVHAVHSYRDLYTHTHTYFVWESAMLWVVSHLRQLKARQIALVTALCSSGGWFCHCHHHRRPAPAPPLPWAVWVEPPLLLLTVCALSLRPFRLTSAGPQRAGDGPPVRSHGRLRGTAVLRRTRTNSRQRRRRAESSWVELSRTAV